MHHARDDELIVYIDTRVVETPYNRHIIKDYFFNLSKLNCFKEKEHSAMSGVSLKNERICFAYT